MGKSTLNIYQQERLAKIAMLEKLFAEFGYKIIDDFVSKGYKSPTTKQINNLLNENAIKAMSIVETILLDPPEDEEVPF